MWEAVTLEYFKVYHTISKRGGLLKLFNYIINKQVDVIVVAYKDRLTNNIVLNKMMQ